MTTILNTDTPFDAHRRTCAQCDAGPYNLCTAGGDLLLAEMAAKPERGASDPMIRPWTQKEIAAYVVGLLRRTCSVCGHTLVKNWGGGLNIVCPISREHAFFAVDTGPFSLGRRVD